MNAASEILLNEVLVEPRELQSILDAFGAEVASAGAAEYSERMIEMLSRLEDLGLIERA